MDPTDPVTLLAMIFLWIASSVGVFLVIRFIAREGVPRRRLDLRRKRRTTALSEERPPEDQDRVA